jgi:hypothetical protein
MTIKNFNEKPHFSFTYGDEVETDDKKLSTYIVNKCWKCLSAAT